MPPNDGTAGLAPRAARMTTMPHPHPRPQRTTSRWANAGARRRTGTLLAGLLWVLGCTPAPSGPPTQAAITPVDPSTAGTIEVTVLITGSVQPPRDIDMSADPLCAAAHPEPVHDEAFVVADGHLVNAVVYIEDGLEGRAFAVPAEPVTIEQRGCLYAPHVLAARVSQPVRFINRDPAPHRVRGGPRLARAASVSDSEEAGAHTVTFDRAEVGIPLRCDTHDWMLAYLSVFDHPYFGVTGRDGAVILRQVPPGQYTIAVWHEARAIQYRSITLEPSGTATLTVTFKDQ